MSITFSNSGTPSPADKIASARERRRRISALDRKKSSNAVFFSRLSANYGPEEAWPRSNAARAAGRIAVPPAKQAVSSRVFCLFAFVALGGALLSLGAGYAIGHWQGKSKMESEIVSARIQSFKRLPAGETAALNQAVAGLRDGKSEASFTTLKDLHKKFPQVASLNYLTALAALEIGRYVLAETHERDSIKAGQRVPDCLALLSMLEGRKSSATMGPKATGAGGKQEELLRAAITADAANPYPHIELANLTWPWRTRFSGNAGSYCRPISLLIS